jgi:hypothetical protein
MDSPDRMFKNGLKWLRRLDLRFWAASALLIGVIVVVLRFMG